MEVLDAPANPVIPPDMEFDPLMLDPARLMDPSFKPSATATPDEPTQTPAADAVTPAATQKPDSTPEAVKPEGVNMRKLRELRETAEKEREQFRVERDALAAKVAELEPRAKTYETERETLQRQLEEREKAIAEAQAAAWRSNAREHPEWKKNAEAIRTVAAEVKNIMELPELREAGIGFPVEVVLNPGNREALNQTIKALNESGRFAEAADLMESFRAVNIHRAELRRVESESAAEAETWAKNREGATGGLIRTVRAGLAADNPVHDTKSAEFLAMPKENQEFLMAQHAEAEAVARRLGAEKPDVVVAEAYKSALALRLTQAALKGWQASGEATQREVAELRAKLAAYEKAAGGGVGGGGRPSEVNLDDPAEVAKSLDPRNLNGYRGSVM